MLNFQIKVKSCAAITLAASILAGCEVAPGSNNEGPGPQAVSHANAVVIFESICMKNYPNIRAARSQVIAQGYRHDKDTNIFYNQTYDLSFKFFESELDCSMVYGSVENYENLRGFIQPIINRSLKEGLVGSSKSDEKFNGRTYINIRQFPEQNN